MTEEQLKQFKRLLELRIAQCESNLSTSFRVDYLEGQIAAYETALKDIDFALEGDE